MEEIDGIIEKAVEEFKFHYEQDRNKLPALHKGEKNPFEYFPPEFWAESDIQCWFRDWFTKQLAPKGIIVHTEVIIDNSIFDNIRLAKLNRTVIEKWKVDLAAFPADFEAGTANGKASFLAEFKYVTNYRSSVDKDIDVEIERIEQAIELGLTESCLVLAVYESRSAGTLRRYPRIISRFPTLHVEKLEIT